MPQTAPATMDATIITQISSQLGTLSASRIMQEAVARQPIRVWPSAPMFQKRIRKAGVTAREMHSRIATFWKVIQVLRAVPKAPSIMAA